jgi:hypothetical protein
VTDLILWYHSGGPKSAFTQGEKYQSYKTTSLAHVLLIALVALLFCVVERVSNVAEVRVRCRGLAEVLHSRAQLKIDPGDGYLFNSRF